MATISGFVSKDELRILLQRGWEIDSCKEVEGREDRDVSIYVDNDLFSIMSGSDWEDQVSQEDVEEELNQLWGVDDPHKVLQEEIDNVCEYAGINLLFEVIPSPEHPDYSLVKVTNRDWPQAHVQSKLCLQRVKELPDHTTQEEVMKAIRGL